MNNKAIRQFNRSSSYKREKSFKYPIFKDEDKTVVPMTSRTKIHSTYDESTSPTPNTKYKNQSKKLCGGDSINSPPLIQLKSSRSTNSQKSCVSKKLTSVNDYSPYKGEVPLITIQQLDLSLSNTNYHTPNSQNGFLTKGNTFSRVVEKYENPNFKDFNDISDHPELSARSNANFKDHSIKISEIAEENSISEQHFGYELSPILRKSPELSLSSMSQYHEINHNISTEGIFLEPSSAVSLPQTSKNRDENQEEVVFRSSLPLKLTENSENIFFMTFEEAYSTFKTLKFEFLTEGIWVKSWKEKFCCIKTEDLDEASLEICEKLVIFAYEGFIPGNFFHERLLSSVFDRLSIHSSKKNTWTDLGFSQNNPYESDLKHDVASLGLLQLLFFEKYLIESFNDIYNYCLENNMAFVLIAFDISEICVTVLRKKLLNKILNETTKVVETVFFMYAGCLMYWFNLYRSQEKMPGEINLLVEKLAIKHPAALINLAREKWTDV
ncbi:hypothetical protein SteCoe_10492 [Stentor coeruleus]|uniref:ELMO domain-containing protein n=1 Tax=Stentor coeruleus TaxID=5963 RepID=A0A1R2CFE3_9CILI|nr:hypothetical protein SteCoe_10492 [Stentor coeruleus]